MVAKITFSDSDEKDTGYSTTIVEIGFINFDINEESKEYVITIATTSSNLRFLEATACFADIEEYVAMKKENLYAISNRIDKLYTEGKTIIPDVFVFHAVDFI
jgi:hypothetical protein